MKCIILAAGYATRLYPLTENFPKPLLKIKGKCILDWLIEDMNSGGYIDEYIVITNDKFKEHFKTWSSKYNNVIVLNDGSTSNENRLGAVMDIKYVIDKTNINDDILVIAGDNLLNFSLNNFIKFAIEKNASCIMHYVENNKNLISRSANITIDKNNKVINMIEKPNEPISNLIVPAFYFYKKDDITLINKAIQDGCGIDAPGSLACYLSKKCNMYSMLMPGMRYDIGNLETYNKINEIYQGIVIK